MKGRELACVAMAVSCAGCGGGGGDSLSANPPPVVNASVGGVWTGVSSSTSLSVLGLVAETGEFQFIQSDGVQYFGTAATTGNSVTGSFSGATPFGFAFADGSTTGTGTVTGSVQARSQLTLATSFRTSRGATTASSLPLTFNALYNRPSSLATIAGNFRDPTTNAVISVTSGGVVFSQDPVTGCVINGSIAVINAAYNAYRVSYTFSNCTGASAALNSTTATGLGTLDNSVSPERAIIGVVNATAGYALTGQYPRT